MSVVSAVVLMCSYCESEDDETEGPDLMDAVDSWLKDRGKSPLTWVEDELRSAKHPQAYIGAGGYNHLDEAAFAEFVMSLPWEEPSRVVLVIQPEYDHQPTMVFRPTGA